MAPTPSTGSIYNVRVEATDTKSATVRWSYNGTSDVKLYRSTNNVSYSLISTTASTFPTTAYTYLDDTLAERTLYYYKLTDDSGLTYSLIVHVVSYLEAAGRGNATSATVSVMPAADEVTPEIFNALIDKINTDNQSNADMSSVPCDVCSVNGALVINCMDGCEWFRTVTTEDINSISLVGCDGCPPVDFVIAPDTERRICGWPVGCNYLNDECFDAPIPGGPDGRVAKTSGLTYGGYWNANPAQFRNQSGSCACPKAAKTLSIKCCSASCTLSCA